MKICRSCQKAWNDKGSIVPGSECYWKHIKTATITFCGCCLKQMAVWFDLQMEIPRRSLPPRPVLRLEGRKS